MSLMPTNEDRIFNEGYSAAMRSQSVFDAMYAGYMAGHRFRIAELEAELNHGLLWVVETRHDYEGPEWNTVRILRHRPSTERLRRILEDEWWEMIEEVPELLQAWSTKSLSFVEDRSGYVYINFCTPSISYLEARAFPCVVDR